MMVLVLWGYDAIVPIITFNSLLVLDFWNDYWNLLTSTPDEEIKTFSKYEMSGLSTYSRYQSNEPNELKKIK